MHHVTNHRFAIIFNLEVIHTEIILIKMSNKKQIRVSADYSKQNMCYVSIKNKLLSNGYYEDCVAWVRKYGPNLFLNLPFDNYNNKTFHFEHVRHPDKTTSYVCCDVQAAVCALVPGIYPTNVVLRFADNEWYFDGYKDLTRTGFALMIAETSDPFTLKYTFLPWGDMFKRRDTTLKVIIYQTLATIEKLDETQKKFRHDLIRDITTKDEYNKHITETRMCNYCTQELKQLMMEQLDIIKMYVPVVRTKRTSSMIIRSKSSKRRLKRLL